MQPRGHHDPIMNSKQCDRLVKYPPNAGDNNGDCESPYDNRFSIYPLIMSRQRRAHKWAQYAAINNNAVWNGMLLFVELTVSHC